MNHITQKQVVALAKDKGALVENWMTNPPRVGLLYMTPEQLHELCNAAIEHYIAQQAALTKVVVLEGAIKDLARWLEVGAAISKREGATNCMVMQEDGSILGGLHVDFSQVVNQPICPDCKAEGLLYECVHCSANNYPDTPKP